MTKEFYSGFYGEFYGDNAKIPEEELTLWLERAAAEVSRLTMGKAAEADSEQVSICICEVAEFMYEYEKRSHIQSENNDGYSVHYRDEDKKISEIVKRYLSGTGLLYRGEEI